MAGLHSHKPDGTEGTAVAKMTYKKEKKKKILIFYGCIVENDENLISFIQNHIKPSADKKLFSNTKYFFYTCDSDFKEERNYIKCIVAYHRFSKPNNSKSCNLSCSPDNIVKVQEHIFLICDSQEVNKCKFLNKYCKKFREAQNLNTVEEIYGLSCEEEKEESEEVCLKFIPLKIKLNDDSSNLYSIIEDTKHCEKLEDAGPVLLRDKTTVVGSFEKKENNEIWIYIFGKKQDIKRQVCSNGSSGSGEVDSEQEEETRSHPKEENKPTDHNLEASSEAVVKLDGESEEDLNMTKENVNSPKCSSNDVMTGVNPKDDPKLEKPEESLRLSSEEKGCLPGQGNDKQGQEHDEFLQSTSAHLKANGLEDQTDSKNSSHTTPSKEWDSSHDQGDEKLAKQEINAGASGSSFHPTDSYEGHVQWQPTAKNNNLASQDQQKATNEDKELLTVPLKQGTSSNYEEKLTSPTQESESDKSYDHIEEIAKALEDGSNKLKDDLGQKDNIKKYRRYLLYVAQNEAGKWQEIGTWLDVKNNKLDNLKIDYQHEGNAEQTYQMLLYWIQSDKNPTLRKLLDALIGTKLVNVADKVSDMIKESSYYGGKPVAENLLNEITNDVKDDWKFLGRYLGIDESTIHSIKMDNRDNTREQARQMFVRWMQSNGRRATTGILIDALHDVGKSNVAKTVQAWEHKPTYS